MTDSPEGTWLTQEAYDRLAAELSQLINVGRKEIAKKISEARDEGDLKENGGYHAAREEQGKIEMRIARLEELLATAVVDDERQSDGTVAAGTIVTLTLNGNEQRFLLGSPEISEGIDIDVFSPESPLGIAIHGLAVGDETSYAAPNGKVFAVKIVNVETFIG
jgi:transcription elongation factor GreA